MRKQPVAGYSPWDDAREPGDRVFDWQGEHAIMYDLRESRGRNKSAVGELTPHLVKKDGKARLAIMDDSGVWFWDDSK